MFSFWLSSSEDSVISSFWAFFLSVCCTFPGLSVFSCPHKVHIGTIAKSLPGDGVICSPLFIFPEQGSEPVIPSSKEPLRLPVASSTGQAVGLRHSHLFPVLLSTFLLLGPLLEQNQTIGLWARLHNSIPLRLYSQSSLSTGLNSLPTLLGTLSPSPSSLLFLNPRNSSV